jgi:aminoglycoside 6'-N-acetyltransferase I
VIERCRSVHAPGWLELRQALWPHASRDAHLAEMVAFCADPARYAQFVAYRDGEPAGLAEAALRGDYVNGTQSSPVTFLEGLYVVPELRRQGVARTLVGEVARWARACGCSELASDASLENATSQAAHRALGFEETERVVFFRKRL